MGTFAMCYMGNLPPSDPIKTGLIYKIDRQLGAPPTAVGSMLTRSNRLASGTTLDNLICLVSIESERTFDYRSDSYAT
jgi:hypothetical protein